MGKKELEKGPGRPWKGSGAGESGMCRTGKALRAFLWGLLFISGITIPSCNQHCLESGPGALSHTRDRDQEFRGEMITRTGKVYCASSTGSGSLVYENLVITAYHVIDSHPVTGDEIGLKFGSDSISWGWVVIFSDSFNDLAILRRPGSTGNGLRLWKGISRDYQPGDQVYSSGYPWGIGPVFTSGYISRIYPDQGYLIVSNNALPGSSGSGIYGMDGKFVGVLVRGIVRMGVWRQFIFHVIPLSRVEGILEDLDIE